MVPNTSDRTRFSDDLVAKRKAQSFDASPTGISLRDLMRDTALSRLSEEVIALREELLPPDGVFIFQSDS